VRADDITSGDLWSATREYLLIRMLRSAQPSPETMGNVVIDLPGSAYIQWTRVAYQASPIHVEVNEGTFTEPMPLGLVGLLTQFGWNAPDDQFRNPWLRSPDRPRPTDLEDMAGTVILTATVGLGLSLEEFSLAVAKHR
jgi:hypothetical protein